ncbi:Acyl carrier protein [Fulvivirga imtechensis AK7]|uniref:Acyl carrier protein n=1 Tax=Fulvivirga imtechensis AK7 TaxID=1237149 RepID=L8JVQ5_9BACT|nr:phosphopantetheine-binding protein [Fulvivirga imtechensis]ELR71307.1 Acyl carrier protein [Fulvivirga imtechensis AK7]
MRNLQEKLKGEIIELLNLEDLQPEDIGNDEPLFGSGVGLDSIDALELIVLLEREYGVKIENPEEGREVFNSINTIAAFIEKNRK